MYDPPDKKESGFSEMFVEAYHLGYEAAKNDELVDDNPYVLSGHERDTTFEDELHYHWYVGYSDFEEGELRNVS